MTKKFLLQTITALNSVIKPKSNAKYLTHHTIICTLLYHNTYKYCRMILGGMLYILFAINYYHVSFLTLLTADQQPVCIFFTAVMQCDAGLTHEPTKVSTNTTTKKCRHTSSVGNVSKFWCGEKQCYYVCKSKVKNIDIGTPKNVGWSELGIFKEQNKTNKQKLIEQHSCFYRGLSAEQVPYAALSQSPLWGLCCLLTHAPRQAAGTQG